MTRDRDPAAAPTGPDVLHEWNVGDGYVYLSEVPYTKQMRYGRPGVPLLFLSGLYVPSAHRGAGDGKRLMEAVTRWADRTGTDLWLYCWPYGQGRRLSEDALAAFYHRFGFRTVTRGVTPGEHEMVRRHAQRRDQD